MNKQWETIDIPGDNYEINRSGTVRQKKAVVHGCPATNVIKQPTINRNGAKVFGFWDGEKQINRLAHRLVAEAFIPNPHNYKIVAFREGDDIDVSNLKWVPGSSIERKRSEKVVHLTERDVAEIKTVLKAGWPITYLADCYDVSVSLISLIKAGKRWVNVEPL